MTTNYIAGAWIDGLGGELISLNPSDIREVVGAYHQAGASDATDAVAAAHAVFASWASSPIQQRFDVLDAAGNEILARVSEIGHLIAREEGKTLPDGIAEAKRTAAIFKFHAGEALRLSGEAVTSTRPGVEVEVRREALGVVALITPWNFPMAIPAWKIAPAIAAGCTIVFKPASYVPACAIELARILERAGLPAGVLNLVVGSGSKIGDVLVSDKRVAGISFTGSVGVGRSLAVGCAARGARVQLEMGGKNPLVILDDADIDRAVQISADGAFFQAGQRCTASSRFIVTRGIHDRFVEALQKRMRQLTVDHALKEGTHIGPVVDGRALRDILGHVDAGRAEGAELVEGGDRLNRETPGHYMAPTLFVGTKPEMGINKEEIFGPVASIQRAEDYEEALAMSNDTQFGLSAGICTTSLKYARDFRRRSETGLVMVNLPTAGLDYHVPFGGRKASNYGPREQGSYAREFFTIVKTAYIDPM
ncbi:MAG TPA: aldehyde dehydrogenase family protein [Mesorhizobium sp.]|jgi:aldehyde dehydrogenase (NAD+)|uniref:aldehyde dehydrogenase family protein n=1 Tax=Mesorhizobium sp. TaxID=1871066 RepID=UPI002DDCDF52|nr:aldehyde dehydrogenase family protein [Mesorhizobium sp.]HEV2501811.1 aldehyde dehydrogenase family protein [Mesorhizobium sp.]